MAEVEADLVREAARVAGKGDDHDGQAAGPHVDELSQALRQTGAEVHHRHRHVALGLRIAARHGRDAALVQRQDAVDVGMPVERVEKVRLARAGVVEHVLHAGRHKLLDDKLRRIRSKGSHLHGEYLAGGSPEFVPGGQ